MYVCSVSVMTQRTRFKTLQRDLQPSGTAAVKHLLVFRFFKNPGVCEHLRSYAHIVDLFVSHTSYERKFRSRSSFFPRVYSLSALRLLLSFKLSLMAGVRWFDGVLVSGTSSQRPPPPTQRVFLGRRMSLNKPCRFVAVAISQGWNGGGIARYVGLSQGDAFEVCGACRK